MICALQRFCRRGKQLRRAQRKVPRYAFESVLYAGMMSVTVVMVVVTMVMTLMMTLMMTVMMVPDPTTRIPDQPKMNSSSYRSPPQT